MTAYSPGSLVLAPFPFTAGGQVKNRPALVLLDTGDADVVLARISTNPPLTPMDVNLAEWKASGLIGPCVVRLHKIVTIEKAEVLRVLGILQPADRQAVAQVLRVSFGNW